MRAPDQKTSRLRGKILIALMGAIAALGAGAALIPAGAGAAINNGNGGCDADTAIGCEEIEIAEWGPVRIPRRDYRSSTATGGGGGGSNGPGGSGPANKPNTPSKKDPPKEVSTKDWDPMKLKCRDALTAIIGSNWLEKASDIGAGSDVAWRNLGGPGARVYKLPILRSSKTTLVRALKRIWTGVLIDNWNRGVKPLFDRWDSLHCDDVLTKDEQRQVAMEFEDPRLPIPRQP